MHVRQSRVLQASFGNNVIILKADTFETSPLAIHRFFDYKLLHSSWVNDRASCHGGWVSNGRVFHRVFKFVKVRPIFSPYLITFSGVESNPRCTEGLWIRTYCSNEGKHDQWTSWLYRASTILNPLLLQYTFTQCMIHTPYRSQYAAIALMTPCTSFTQILLTKSVIFSQALTLAPWRWFLCKPKHVGAFLSNLECFNNSTFLTLFASVGNKRGFTTSEVPYFVVFSLWTRNILSHS